MKYDFKVYFILFSKSYKNNNNYDVNSNQDDFLSNDDIKFVTTTLSVCFYHHHCIWCENVCGACALSFFLQNIKREKYRFLVNSFERCSYVVSVFLPHLRGKLGLESHKYICQVLSRVGKIKINSDCTSVLCS